MINCVYLIIFLGFIPKPPHNFSWNWRPLRSPNGDSRRIKPLRKRGHQSKERRSHQKRDSRKNFLAADLAACWLSTKCQKKHHQSVIFSEPYSGVENYVFLRKKEAIFVLTSAAFKGIWRLFCGKNQGWQATFFANQCGNLTQIFAIYERLWRPLDTWPQWPLKSYLTCYT